MNPLDPTTTSKETTMETTIEGNTQPMLPSAPEGINRQLAQFVRTRRKALGWSQQVVATEARISRRTVQSIEYGKDVKVSAIHAVTYALTGHSLVSGGLNELEALLAGQPGPFTHLIDTDHVAMTTPARRRRTLREMASMIKPRLRRKNRKAA